MYAEQKNKLILKGFEGFTNLVPSEGVCATCAGERCVGGCWERVHWKLVWSGYLLGRVFCDDPGEGELSRSGFSVSVCVPSFIMKIY